MQTPATPADTALDPADIAIAQAEARQRRRRRWLIAGGVASLLVSYILGPRPITILERTGMLPAGLTPILRVIYSPVLFAINTVPFVKHFYEWYCGIQIP